MAPLVIAVAAASLGALAAAVDPIAGGLDQTGPWRALDLVLNAGWVWAGLAVLAGSAHARPVVAAAVGAADLFLAVAAYYVVGLVAGDRTGLGLADLAPTIRMWLVLAIVAGPALGLVGVLTRRRTASGLAARLVVPAGIAVEELALHRLGPATFRVDPWLGRTQASMLVLAAGWVVVAVSRWRHEPDDAASRISPARSSGRV